MKVKNKIALPDKKYRFATELLLLKNGQLIEKYDNFKERKQEQFIINNLPSRMEIAANKTISFEKGVLLRTFLGVMEPYISRYNIVCSGWLKPLYKEYKEYKEYKKDRYANIQKSKSIKYLEVYKTVDFSLYQLNKSDMSKAEAVFEIYTGFQGIGKKTKKEKGNNPYSFSLSSIAGIDYLPLRINNTLLNSITLMHYPYTASSIKFEKLVNGMYRMINKDKKKDYRYNYNINEILSKEISGQLKQKMIFPDIQVSFTLAEVIRSIVDEMTFFGLGKERENAKRDLDRRARDVEQKVSLENQ